MSDIDMSNSLERQDYKLVKNRLKTLLLYLDSSDYAISSITKSNEIIDDHLFIYNTLRKRFNAKYGVPCKQHRFKFNRLYFKVVHRLCKYDNSFSNLKYFIKFVSIYC